MVKVPPITDTTAFKLLEPVVTVAFGASLLRTFGVQWTRGLIYSTSLRYIAGRLIPSRQPVKAPPPAPITRSKADEQLITRLKTEKGDLEQRVQGLEGDNRELQKQVKGLKTEKRDLEQRVQGLEGDNGELREQVQKLATEATAQKEVYQKLEQERDTWKQRTEELEKEKQREKENTQRLTTQNQELMRQLEQLRGQLITQQKSQQALLTSSETERGLRGAQAVETVRGKTSSGVGDKRAEKENRSPGDGAKVTFGES